jgi:16S rRNA processing protein RimM
MPAMETVIIGVVLRAHGVNGVVRARATGPTLAVIGIGDPVRVTTRDGATRDLTLISRTATGDTYLLAFDGVGVREEAEALRGAELRVDHARLPPPDDADEYYVRDLVGCEVWAGSALLGTVRDVINRPANDVLEIVAADGIASLLPFSADAVREIDVPARRIVLRGDLLDGAPDDRPSGGGHAN